MRKSRILSLVLMLALVLTPVVSMARVGRSYAQDECTFDDGNSVVDEVTDASQPETTDCAAGTHTNGEYVGGDGDDIINVGVNTGAVDTTFPNSLLLGDGNQNAPAPYSGTAAGDDIINIAVGSTITCTGTQGGIVGDFAADSNSFPPGGDPSGQDTFNLDGTVNCNIYGDSFDLDTDSAYVGTGAAGSNDTFDVTGDVTGTLYGQGGNDSFTLNLTAYGTTSTGSFSGAATFDGGENATNVTAETTGDQTVFMTATLDVAVYNQIVSQCTNASGGCTFTVGGKTFTLVNMEAINTDALICSGCATPVTPGVTPSVTPSVTPVGGTTGGDSGGGVSGGGGTVTVTFILVPIAPAKVGNAFVGGGILALGNIRIRQTPDLGGSVLGQIPWGTIVTVLKDNPSKEWVFIRYGAIEGWVSANWFVLPNGDTLYSPEELGLGFIIPANGARAVGNVRMRSQPNLGAAVVGQVPWGRIVTILDEDPTGLWWLISFRGTQAWVSNEWFEIPDGSIYTPYGGFFTPGEVPAEEYVLDLSDVHAASGTAVALAPVRLRFAPTLAAPRMGLVDWGDVVVIRGVDSTGNWWLVDYDGTSGWVANEWFVRQ